MESGYKLGREFQIKAADCGAKLIEKKLFIGSEIDEKSSLKGVGYDDEKIANLGSSKLCVSIHSTSHVTLVHWFRNHFIQKPIFSWLRHWFLLLN